MMVLYYTIHRFKYSLIIYAIRSFRRLQGHPHRRPGAHQQTFQRPHLRAGPLRDVQQRRAQLGPVPTRPDDGRPGLQHPKRDRCVLEHRGAAAPQRRDDQGGQDLQGQVHVQHELEEHYVRHDAYSVSAHGVILRT